MIHGLGGNDTIYGLDGNDFICGGDGHDIINGADGAVVQENWKPGGRLSPRPARPGYDRIYGGDGDDIIVGNRIYGGNGDDIMTGDWVDAQGGDGNDTLFGCGDATGGTDMSGGAWRRRTVRGRENMTTR